MSLPRRAVAVVGSARAAEPPGVGVEARGHRRPRTLVSRVLHRRSDSDGLLEWASGLGAALRSGEQISVGLRQAVERAPESPDSARRAVTELAHGRMMRLTLLDWRRRAASSEERLIVTALLVAGEHGGDAGAAIEVVVDRLRDQRFIASRRRVLTAQAHATAVVLVLLPVVFAAFTSAVRGELPFAGGGVVLLAVGVAFDGLGFYWMRRLRRRWL